MVAKPDQEILDAMFFIELAQQCDRVGAMASMDNPEERQHPRPDAPTRQGLIRATEFPFLEGGDCRPEVLDPRRFFSS
ncbi:MAG: hypothetical protein ABSD62_13345 [Candidatus Limnocylindrales bacterium]|jgi:hypothetical protein